MCYMQMPQTSSVSGPARERGPAGYLSAHGRPGGQRSTAGSDVLDLSRSVWIDQAETAVPGPATRGRQKDNYHRDKHLRRLTIRF